MKLETLAENAGFGPAQAAGVHAPSPLFIAVMVLGGLVAVWCGASWAFNVRGIATRRAENIRQRYLLGGAQLGQLDRSPTMWAQAWYQRLLGAFMAVAGLVMVLGGSALWLG
ncbi:hypothetical protein AB0D12_16645 [Streptomyces sp. NPDC048479]|uniref:hypothetical protein n=1 Tax=Streptomyces sp. NPDC048479 TaxID=3154725 RepID=UPI003436042B